MSMKQLLAPAAFAAALVASSPVVAVTVGFTEVIGPSTLEHTTDPRIVSSALGTAGAFDVSKVIGNATVNPWNTLAIDLLSCTSLGGGCSPGTTSANFGPALPGSVLLNSVVLTFGSQWIFAQTISTLVFSLAETNRVMPGDQLTLNFGMTGFLGPSDENTFFALHQVASVPEPQTYALMIAGLLMLGFMARRRLGQ